MQNLPNVFGKNSLLTQRPSRHRQVTFTVSYKVPIFRTLQTNLTLFVSYKHLNLLKKLITRYGGLQADKASFSANDASRPEVGANRADQRAKIFMRGCQLLGSFRPVWRAKRLFDYDYISFPDFDRDNRNFTPKDTRC